MHGINNCAQRLNGRLRHRPTQIIAVDSEADVHTEYRPHETMETRILSVHQMDEWLL